MLPIYHSIRFQEERMKHGVKQAKMTGVRFTSPELYKASGPQAGDVSIALCLWKLVKTVAFPAKANSSLWKSAGVLSVWGGESWKEKVSSTCLSVCSRISLYAPEPRREGLQAVPPLSLHLPL